ncbi:MAG: WxcM-like domain-containing protein [Bacteroidaceae bacterium]|nr:WxcM-like domain-containing protein [Bacteroidaceae bacterium]
MISDKVHIIELPTIRDYRGNLSIAESGEVVPFDIARTYWIYDVPGGAHRSGHAFRTQHEFIVALSGSFDVILDNGIERKRYHLCRSHYGLYVPNMMWRELDNFSTGSVAMVLSSTQYDPNDYIENYEDYCNQLSHEE